MVRTAVALGSLVFGALPVASVFAQRAPQPANAATHLPAFQMPAPTPNDTLKSVEVQPDHHVRFRIWAPNATEVKLQATPNITSQEAYKNMGGVPLVKGDQGIWDVVIGRIESGVYRYTFTVDGVSTPDPRNPLSS